MDSNLHKLAFKINQEFINLSHDIYLILLSFSESVEDFQPEKQSLVDFSWCNCQFSTNNLNENGVIFLE